MARSFARVKASVWVDEDWRRLSPGAQWCYMLLISQPQINNCGIVPYQPRRWARMAAGVTPEHVAAYLTELARANFIIVDEGSEEILVRSFVKHDEIAKQPKLVISARRQFGEIQSDTIPEVLRREYPQLFERLERREDLPVPLSKELQGERSQIDNTPQAATEAVSTAPTGLPRAPSQPAERDETSTQAETGALGEPLAEDLPQDLFEGVAEPLPEGVNAHAREGPLQPTGGLRGTFTGNQQTADRGYPFRDHATADADRLTTRLSTAGWRPAQIPTEEAELLRATAWLDRAESDTAITNVGGYAWSQYDAGGWPPEQPRQPHYSDPSTVCPDCRETLGAGHLETCPRIAKPAPEPEEVTS